MRAAVLGIDPGSAKAGYAVVAPDGTVIVAGIEPVAALASKLAAVLVEHPAELVAVGKGTQSRAIAAELAILNLPVAFVDEFGTSRRARELYFADHPPRGWRRLIPLGLQVPPRPVDDYAAILIARSYLARTPPGAPAN